METLTGKIYRVVFESDTSDFKVFTLRRKSNHVISVTGDFPVLLPGAQIEVHGKYKTHHKYGVNFEADAHTFNYEANNNSLCLYIQSIAKWIGPERSRMLAEHFGSDLEKIIQEDPERLAEVEGVGKKVATSLAEAWELNKEMKNIRIFLHSLGLTRFKIKKLIGMFGIDSEQVISENPWILHSHGFGFTTCDHIANRLKRDMHCRERYEQFVLYTLSQTLSSGHLYLTPSQLMRGFNKYNRSAQYPFSEKELTIAEVAPHIKHLVTEGFIVNDQNRLYKTINFFFESESARLIAKIKKTQDTCKFKDFEADVFIERYETQHDIILSEAQKDAIRSFIKEKVLIITGSPGTGKTTVVKAFVQLLKEHGLSFELLTPTGIAAKKLGNTAGCEAYTIHRRLGYRGSEWSRNAMEKYNTQAVIVDETSMVDMEVFYRLISALYANTKLVFVGDNDQLPSVGPGSVLKELIDCGQIKTIFLKDIFRQAAHSEIILEAKKIKEGDTDLTLFRKNKEADIWHIDTNDVSRIEATIVKFAKQLKDLSKTRKDLGFQIITPRNQGPLSVDSLNTLLQSILNPPGPNVKEIKSNNTVIRKGDRVLIRKNHYDLSVFNGDIGKVKFITRDHVVVDLEDFFDREKRVQIPMNIVDDMLKLAYSVTIHKAQGTEHPIIIMPFIKAHGKLLLQRNLLYTALTRAKKKVIVLGQEGALIDAIKNDKIQRRNTIFGERINSWINDTGISLRDIYSRSGSYQNAKLLDQLLSLEGHSS